jgi:heptosyltransferase-2
VKPKLLILELWGLGDLVIATPFILAAARKYAVTLLAKPFAAEMRPRLWPAVEVVPFIAPWTAFRFGAKYGVWRWPWADMLRLHRELRAKNFDYAVSARWDPRDHFLLKTVGARERLGFPRWKSGRYLTQPLTRPDPLAHRIVHWRVAGAALGLVLPPKSEIFVTPRALPPVVLVHTGARLPLRVWPLKNVLEIVRRLRQLHYSVQIACDGDQLGWWRGQGEDALCPRTVSELLACLDQAGIFIGNDSGPGHLASGCGLPTFTLFGPQLHEWFAPLHPAAEWIEGKACPYKPCSDYCRFATPFCLWEVSVEDVWPRVEAFVGRHLMREENPSTAAADVRRL